MSTHTPSSVHDLIASCDWTDSLDELGEQIIERQLVLHAEATRDALERAVYHRSLVAQSADRIIDSITDLDDLEILKSLPIDLVKKAIWLSDDIPYPKYRLLRRLLAPVTASNSSEDTYGARDFLSQDIDEWILVNERALRDDGFRDWKRGLVDWGAHSELVFDSPVASLTMRDEKFIMRPADLPGFAFLDELRPSTITVQPNISTFRATFVTVTDGLLKGLDWSHIFVAGGVVLSTLLAVSDAKVKQSLSSDVDIYIYGLGPVEANAKIRHIFEVWRGNLPEEAQSSVMAVRNSGTITLFAQYPLKRIQVVLKLVKDPKEVLLNFDLDICSMGFDGESLLMLPRACRALETGYNVFTMDLVHGHYLGRRRASQESRVFKYADKGFGLRILQSYLDQKTTRANEMPLASHGWPLVSPSTIAQNAASWTNEVVESYRHLGRSPESRFETPLITPYMLGPAGATFAREDSCLSGFEHMMRHVHLWRLAIAKEVRVPKSEWASTTYLMLHGGYDDDGRKNHPLYTWDSQFDIDKFKSALTKHNNEGAKTYSANARFLFGSNVKVAEFGLPMRIRSKDDIANLLDGDGDVILHLFVAPGFTTFANATIRAALEEHGLSPLLPRDAFEVLPFGPGTLRNEEQQTDRRRNVEVVQWRIDPILAWQQIDRRIDEVFEIMWAFYRSHSEIDRWTSQNRLAKKFYRDVGKRSIHRHALDEMDAFSTWLTRPAVPILAKESSFGQVVMDLNGEWPFDSEEE